MEQEQSMTSRHYGGTLQGRSPGLYSNDEINQSEQSQLSQIVNIANHPSRPSANTQYFKL